MRRGLILPCALLFGLAAMAPKASSDQVNVIAQRSAWKYTTGSDLGTAWRAPGASEAGWLTGPGVLGYGESYVTTAVPMGPNGGTRYPTTYFRRAFTLIDAPAEITSLTLGASYDDGFVAYLNGVEVARRELPTGAIAYGTLATSHEGGIYEGINLNAFLGLLVPGVNLLAVELHQNTLTSNDLVWDGELNYSTTPILTRGPYLQVGTPSGLRVRWRTDAPCDSRVRVGLTPLTLATVFDNATLTTEHEVVVSGRDPNTRYYYSIGSTTETLAGGDATTFFVTAPVAGTPKSTRVWVIGDAGRASLEQVAVRDGYEQWTGTRHTDLWLMLGDNAYNTGTDAEYSAGVFNIYPEMLRKSVVWPTRGNHDNIHAGPNNDYYDIFTLPIGGEAGGLATGNEAYYSFDYGNIHFICLDSEGTSRTVSSPMMVWLRNDVAATTREWVVAYWHHPPYTKGSHDSDDAGDSAGRMRDMRQVALPILDSTGVDLVLTGHSHSYERSFLLKQHYGLSTTLTASMKVDSGDGRPAGDGRYEKTTLGTGPFEGAVYVVAGSSGQTSGGPLNHPVMVVSENLLGSLVLDVVGPQLEARFIDVNGVARDSFTILKGATTAVVGAGKTELRVAASPNPFASTTRIAYTLPRAGRVRLQVHDLGGRRIATVADRDQSAGSHATTWDGGDDARVAVPAGVYFAVLEFEGGKRATRIVRLK